MTATDIQTELVRFLNKRSPSVTPKNSLRDDLCLDSLDIVELICHLEEKFKIEFEGEQLPRLDTVEDLARHAWSLVSHPRRH